MPFRQVRERGFEAHDDGAPLTVVDVQIEREVPLLDLMAALPDVAVDFSDRGGFETDDAEYADVVRTIIAEEIGQGEGANLVVGRHYRAQLDAVGARPGAHRPAPAAAARARGLLDLPLLHRRALPRRREPRAPRLGARR